MTRCLLLREGGLLCPLPLITCLLSEAASLVWTVLSEMREQLTTQLPLPLASQLYLTGSLGVWGREVPGPRAGLAQGTGGVGLAWGNVPLALGAADTCGLVGWKLAGDDPRLGQSSSGGAKSQPAHSKGGLQASAGTGASQRPWSEALGMGDGEAVKTGYGRPSPSTWAGKLVEAWTYDMLCPLDSSI